jgi:aminoacyl-tRNA hydrolase
MQLNFVKALVRLRAAVAWRLHRLLGDKIVYGALLVVAKLWRRALKKPIYVAVVGSGGKTTTKELLLGMLSQKGKGVGNPSSLNNLEEIAMALLRVRPGHAFFATELSENRPGAMDKPLALLQPDIGVVTVVQDDHLTAFSSREELAAEMAKLITALPATGTAVLNADDERVLGMASHCAAKVITYGSSDKADLRAEGVSSVWPERLQMTLVRGDERVKLQTQLCGVHWLPSVLGAIGSGLAAGMTLGECAAGLAKVAPFEGRMQPVMTPGKVTFIRDDFKAPLWTLDACFEFMKAAKADRKIIVIGELSDVGSKKGQKYARAAALAQQIADITVFVGPWASSALKMRKTGDGAQLHAFNHVRDAAEFLKSISREGDLVLLKGSSKKDHLLRIIMARTNSISCWRDDCKLNMFCDACPQRNNPVGVPPARQSPPAPPQHDSATGSAPQATPTTAQIFVGLGNPGSQFDNTPHNVGYALADRLATAFGLTWEAQDHAWLARGLVDGRNICIVKLRAEMNLTGDKLKKLSQQLSFGPEQCILLYDDLDLPLGTVRPRPKGGAGGHRGVASILEAFQTDGFRRIKIGVGPADTTADRVDHVLRIFDAQSQAVIDQAIPQAQAHALEMAWGRTKAADPQMARPRDG